MDGANSQGDGGIEQVSLDEVLKEVSLPTAGRELAPLTRVGYKLALFILAYLAAVTVFLFVDYFYHAPSLPAGAAVDAGQVKLYQELSQGAVDRMLKLLDAFVLKGFLPVFTAVLGYIFGSRGDRE